MVRARILIQELWRRNLPWDTPIIADLQQKWLGIATDIQESVTEHATLPRQYLPLPIKTTRSRRAPCLCRRQQSMSAQHSCPSLTQHLHFLNLLWPSPHRTIEVIDTPKTGIHGCYDRHTTVQFHSPKPLKKIPQPTRRPLVR